MSASTSTLSVSGDSIGFQLENVGIAFIVLETFFVGLRYVARYSSGTRGGFDDWIMPAALLFNLGLCAQAISMVAYGGVGRHIMWLETNDLTALTTFLKMQIPFTILYALAVTFPKLAILGLYLRVFIQKRYRITSYVLIAILSSSCLSVVIVTFVQCTPVSYLWDPTAHPDGHCIDINSFWRWGSFPNVITDLVMLVLPLPCIWTLQLSKKDKVGLVITFCTGSVGLVTSIVRFTTFFETNGQTDSTWTAVKLGAISIAEAGVYLFAACFPTYRTLYRSVRARTGLTTVGGSRSAGPQTGSELVSVQSKSGKVFGTTSFSGFERMDEESNTLVDAKSNYTRFEDSSFKEASSVDSGMYGSDNQIHVKQDYVVTTSPR